MWDSGFHLQETENGKICLGQRRLDLIVVLLVTVVVLMLTLLVLSLLLMLMQM